MQCYLNVVNVYKNFFSDYVKKIHVIGIMGELGIYAGHSPLLTIIKPGPLCIFQHDKQTKYFYISKGILEVQPKNISILSDTVINHVDLCFEKLFKEKNILENKIKQLKNYQFCILRKKLSIIVSKLKVLKLVKENNII